MVTPLKARRKRGLFVLFLLCGGLGAGGGLLANKRTAEEILNQVVLSLDRQQAVTGRKPSHERGTFAKTGTSPQDEIPHLKRVIDEKENEGKQVASHPPLEQNGVAGDGFSWDSGILVIPSSHGVPILPGATDASAARVPPPHRRNAYVPVQADPPPRTHPDAKEVLAAPLVPVEVLTPIQSLDGRQRVSE